MGFTIVPDKATGDVFTEAMWDTYIKDNFNTGVPVRLADATLGSAAAVIDLQDIPQLWTHLMLLAYLRGDTAATTITAWARFNNDTGANYDSQILQGNAATPAAAETFGSTLGVSLGSIPAGTAPANLFSGTVMGVPNYVQTSNNKATVGENALKFGTTTGLMVAYGFAGFWRSNVAISRLTLALGAGNFVTGSRVTLYGMP